MLTLYMWSVVYGNVVVRRMTVVLVRPHQEEVIFQKQSGKVEILVQKW